MGDKLLLDRIVCEKRINRTRYTWWRYTIKDNCISIRALKQEYPTIDSIFMALLRDIEFIKNYLSSRFIIKNKGEALGIVKEDLIEYKLNLNRNRIDLFSIDKKTKQIKEDVINLPLEYFILLLATEYDKYIKLMLDGTDMHYRLILHGEDNKPWYKRSFSYCFKRFKEMKDGQIDMFISKYFAGFNKSKHQLKLFAYEQCHNWHDIDQFTEENFYDYITKIFGKELRKFYILFHKNGYEINDNIDRRFVKKLQKLFEESGCTFN